MGHPPSLRTRSLGVCLIAVMGGACLAGCSDDAPTSSAVSSSSTSTDPASSSSTTTAPSASTTSAPGAQAATATSTSTSVPGADASTTTTGAPLTDAEFAARLRDLGAQLDTAGPDLCQIYTVMRTPPPTSATTAQTRLVVTYAVRVLHSAALSLSSVDPTASATLNGAADALTKEADAAGYPPGFFNARPKAMQGDAYEQALRTVVDQTSKCPAS
jgi:hypothetical protein